MKPILFNTEMVRAILSEQKTVTRRVIKCRCINTKIQKVKNEIYEVIQGAPATDCFSRKVVPPFKTGDILYVRETWCDDCCDHVIYKADGESTKVAEYAEEPKWHPSIHMPKEYVRLFLRVTNIYAERLQDMTDDDCMREGIEPFSKDGKLYKFFVADDEGDWPRCEWRKCPRTPKDAMKIIWDLTVKKADLYHYGWEANPWVWVIEFERIGEEEVLDYESSKLL